MKAAALAVLLGLYPMAAMADLCILPLEGGAPEKQIEREQPHRIISNSKAITGFPYVLARPWNRRGGPLMTVREMSYEPLGTAFPNSPIFDDFTPPRSDGSVWGWGWHSEGLYRLAPGTDVFLPVPGTENGRRFTYDRSEGRLYMLLRQQLFEVDETGTAILSDHGGWTLSDDPLRTQPDPLYPREATLPQFVPPLGVHLAAIEEEDVLWMREPDGTWRPLDHGGPIQNAYEVQKGRWHDDPVEGILTLLIGDVGLVFDARAMGEAHMLYRFDRIGGGAFPEGQAALIWEAPERLGRIARWLGVVPKPPRPRWVTRQGLVAVTEADLTTSFRAPPRPPSRGVSGHRVLNLPEFDTFLITHETGQSIYREGRIEILPQLSRDAVGKTIFVHRFGGRVFLSSLQGFYELDAMMNATPLSWPAPQHKAWDVIEAPGLGGALFKARATDEVWFTTNGRQFERVENRTGAARVAFGAELPDRPAMLAASSAGAALILACP